DEKTVCRSAKSVKVQPLEACTALENLSFRAYRVRHGRGWWSWRRRGEEPGRGKGREGRRCVDKRRGSGDNSCRRKNYVKL
ncbi:hypothetical protein CSX02_03870, partial [Agathobacter ruminis]